MPESITVDSVSKRFELGALRHENMLRERLMSMLRGSFIRGRSRARSFGPFEAYRSGFKKGRS